MSKEKQIEEMARVMANGRFVEPDRNQILLFAGEAETLYNAGYRKQEWISVEDRLPDDDSFVLLCTNKGTIVRGRYQHKWKRWDGLNHRLNITHWMPLPEAPKMRKEDEGN